MAGDNETGPAMVTVYVAAGATLLAALGALLVKMQPVLLAWVKTKTSSDPSTAFLADEMKARVERDSQEKKVLYDTIENLNATTRHLRQLVHDKNGELQEKTIEIERLRARFILEVQKIRAGFGLPPAAPPTSLTGG